LTAATVPRRERWVVFDLQLTELDDRAARQGGIKVRVIWGPRPRRTKRTPHAVQPDSRSIQLTLGHASIQQTQRYLNVTDEELRRGLEVSWINQGRPLRAVSGS